MKNIIGIIVLLVAMRCFSECADTIAAVDKGLKTDDDICTTHSSNGNGSTHVDHELVSQGTCAGATANTGTECRLINAPFEKITRVWAHNENCSENVPSISTKTQTISAVDVTAFICPPPTPPPGD